MSCFALSFIALTATAVAATQPSSTSVQQPLTNPDLPETASNTPMAMMPSVAPLFLEGSGFSSRLNIINEASVAIKAQIDIYSLEGTKVTSKSVILEPFGLRQISLRSLLADAGSNVDAGSIRVTSDHEGAMLAALALTHHGITDTYFDEELAMPSMDGSNLLRGVADNVTFGSPLIAISSLSSAIQRVIVTCLREEGASKGQTFDLAPNQTLLTEACSNGTRYPLLSAADVVTNHSEAEPDEGFGHRSTGAVGVSIQTDGMPGELATYGVIAHVVRHEIFYSSLNFTDPKMRMSSGVAYTGVPVGPSPLLPEGNYKPELAIANFGTKTTSVTVNSGTTIDGAPQKRLLATISVAPGTVKTLKLDEIAPSPALLNSVVIHSNGAPGDIATKLTSRSGSSPLHVIEMLEREESKGANGGGHPWTVENGTTSVLLLFNHDPKENKFVVRFKTPNGTWMKNYKLAPMETRALDINALIRNREKDDNGHVLSLTATSGEVGWQSDSTEVGGRVLQANPALAMARNFSCSNYVSQCAVYISPYTSLNLGYGNNGDLGTIDPTWYVFGLHPPTSCSCSGGSPTSSQLSVSYTWSSGNSSIANITSGTSSNLSVWHGAGVGSTVGNYSAYQSAYNILCAGQASVKIRGPYQVVVAGTNSNTSNVCSSGAGWYRNVTLQIADQDGNAFPISGTVLDTISIGRNDLGITSIQTGSSNTNAQGQWTDSYPLCSNACPASTGETDTIQQWSLNGLPLPKTNAVIYKCKSITINGQ